MSMTLSKQNGFVITWKLHHGYKRKVSLHDTQLVTKFKPDFFLTRPPRCCWVQQKVHRVKQHILRMSFVKPWSFSQCLTRVWIYTALINLNYECSDSMTETKPYIHKSILKTSKQIATVVTCQACWWNKWY